MEDKILKKIKKRLLLYGIVLGVGVAVSKCTEEQDVISLQDEDVDSYKDEYEYIKISGQKLVNEISCYLESGYELIVFENSQTGKVLGSLIYKNGDCSIKKTDEIELEEFMIDFENIKNYLPYQFCVVRYDFERMKYINSINYFAYSNPDNGDFSTGVIDELEVEADDLFSSFVYQDMKIKKYIESNDQKYVKKKEI